MITWIKAAAISLFAILAPVHTVMAASGVLIVADLILGILAARKRGDAITSAALRRTVTKILVYQAAIITGFICEHYLLSDSLPIVKIAAAAIGMVEIKSILENLNEVNGSPIFASLISSLGSKNDKENPPSA